MTRPIAIFGTGGNSREILLLHEFINQNNPMLQNQKVVFVEQDEMLKETTIMERPVIPESQFNSLGCDVLLGPGNSEIRKKIVSKLPSNTCYPTVFHSGIYISRCVEIGKGSILFAGVNLTCNIHIGEFSQINLNCTISHDCQIGDYFTAAPGANINGNCIIGNHVFIGSNACIKQGTKICDNVIIGMGSVVVKDINEAGVYIGNPLTKLR